MPVSTVEHIQSGRPALPGTDKNEVKTEGLLLEERKALNSASGGTTPGERKASLSVSYGVCGKSNAFRKKSRKYKPKLRWARKHPVVVIKIGSSSVMNPEQPDGINRGVVDNLATCIREMREMGTRVVLVSSGAVAFGCKYLKLSKQQTSKQALAAVGQGVVMSVWQRVFDGFEIPVSQMLLTRENFGKRHHYENARAALNELLRIGVVPIVNENDCVAIEELKIGDNDTLSALVASMLSADWLFMLTDVDALYTANPQTNPNAKPIHTVEDLNRDLEALQSATSGPLSGKWGTGGMGTKVSAARYACAAGVNCVITHADAPERMMDIMAGEKIGTVFCGAQHRLRGEKRMIAHGLKAEGSLHLDQGAADAVRCHKNLFVVGVKGVHGDFPNCSIVRLLGPDGAEVGRGMCRMSSSSLREVVDSSVLKNNNKLMSENRKVAKEIVERNCLCVGGETHFYGS